MRSGLWIAVLLTIIIFIVFWYIVAQSFYDIQTDLQKTFVSDGCTLFIDGEWSECCTEHDRVYWHGGSAQERRLVDKDLQKCVYETTHNAVLSYIIYGAVRIAGIPYVNTSWRWGYGWKFGRGYR